MFCDIKDRLSNPSVLRMIAYSEFEESLERASKRSQEYHNDAAQYFYGWVENGEILGTCAFHIYSDKTVIDGIAVAKNTRRRGIGGAMVAALQQKCNTLIEAETDDDAVDFYRRRGFIVSEAPKKKDYCRWLCTLPTPAKLLLQKCSDITLPDLTGQIIEDVNAFLSVNGKQKAFSHVKAVAEKNIEIAERYDLDKIICEASGYLHDISAVISPKAMLSYAEECGWYIDEAEKRYPFLLHQRISRVIAVQHFSITDERILSSIEYHSTLKVNPSKYDMALFVSDKLAWDQEGSPPFFSMVNNALERSLEEASLSYMNYIIENKMILYPHKWFNEGVAFLRGVCEG